MNPVNHAQYQQWSILKANRVQMLPSWWWNVWKAQNRVDLHWRRDPDRFRDTDVEMWREELLFWLGTKALATIQNSLPAPWQPPTTKALHASFLMCDHASMCSSSTQQIIHQRWMPHIFHLKFSIFVCLRLVLQMTKKLILLVTAAQNAISLYIVTLGL